MNNEEPTKKEKKYNFEKLTPTTDADTSVYEKALDFVFENNDVKNVAISGAYGSGKSSMLNSYKKNSKHKFMHLSLAHFQTKNSEGTGSNEKVLEGKILNQLIHQMDAEKIPQTNFKVKQKISTKRVMLGVALTILFVISLFHTIFFSAWEALIKELPTSFVSTLLKGTVSPWFRLINLGVILVLIGVFICKLIKAQLNKNIFKKLSIQGNEIEIFEDNNESYFDKYLNEVLYLFENAEVDVIVFEDMDRFDAHQIFERLREINTLVNLQLEKKNRVLRFFYLLKDDIFISKDRTKFFDFIIPIVPIVDASNSYDQFIEHLKKTDIIDKFTQDFLKGLSLYIDDMRLLKNICNEFLIYFNRLDKIELSYDKMLAIIAYKNLFPRDFSELQLGRGFVANLFDKKGKFIEEEIINIQEQIASLVNQKEGSKKEIATSIEELNSIYWTKLGYCRNSNPESSLSLDMRKEYKRRRECLEKRNEISLEELEDKIYELNKKKQELKGLQLSEIITRDNIDSIFATSYKDAVGNINEFKEIRENNYFNLLKFLIRKGYLDESYSDYMTYFYENSLTVVDKKFLRSVTDKKSKEYNYELRSPELVCAHLSEIDFKEPEVLNFTLLTHLLETDKSNYLSGFVGQLKELKKFDFVWEYFEKVEDKSKFLKILAQEWPQLSFEIIVSHAWSNIQIKRFSIEMLTCLTVEELEHCNHNDCLSKFINSEEKYLDIENPNVEKLISAFRSLNIKFEKINYHASNKELFEGVYKNSLYSLTYENIALMLQVFAKATDDEIRHKNYSIINSMEDKCLKVYVDSNIVDYLNLILENSEGQICDEEKVVALILNNSFVQREQKDKYILQLKTTFIDLTAIEDFTYWSKMMKTDVLAFSETNVLEYFTRVETFDDVLLEYVNKTNQKIDFSSLIVGFENAMNFFDECIMRNDLLNNKYEQILKSMGLKKEKFDIVNLNDEKLEILIRGKIILMNENNLLFIRENYSSSLFSFIQTNLEEYLEVMDDDLLEHKEVLEILDWQIEDENKLKLLSFDESPISIVNKNYSIAIQCHILKNNFDETDKSYLFHDYNKFNEAVRRIIFDVALTSLDEIIEYKMQINVQLLQEMITCEKIIDASKIELIVSQFNYISVELMKELLELMGLVNFLEIFSPHKRPRFEDSEVNQLLLHAFKDKGLIYEYYEDEKKPNTYLIRRRAPFKITKEGA